MRCPDPCGSGRANFLNKAFVTQVLLPHGQARVAAALDVRSHLRGRASQPNRSRFPWTATTACSFSLLLGLGGWQRSPSSCSPPSQESTEQGLILIESHILLPSQPSASAT